MKKLFILMTILGALSFNLSLAQNAKPDTATLNFINHASIGGLQEVESGKLAIQKGKSADIKSFGKRMVTDHTKANTQLMNLVKSKGYQIKLKAIGEVVPDKMLSQASAADFDRIYVEMMVADHRATVYLFQTYAIAGKDPDVKAFAQQTLPTLKAHLAAIKAIDDKMKTASK
ncbi:MAG: hypothetical protein JWP45_700 [Mucilaginibacter sp.]|nr:hypothetical protein [Mucilaginibacter sp.]